VQTIDTPCLPEPASGVTLFISTPTGQKIDSIVTDNRGTYSISLPPGVYQITMAPPGGLEFTKDLPATITITEKQETRLDIWLDTGIR
jgi:hypothetical protein